jgi:hypothetical protein
MNSPIQVRPARPIDIPRILRLLPGITRHPSQTQTYVVERAGNFIGCGSLMFHSDSVCAFGWNFISIDEKAAGTEALFSAFHAEAERQQMKTLMAHFGVPENGQDAAFFISRGCREHTAFTFYETGLERGEALFDRAVSRLQKNKKIPAQVRVIPLAQAPALPVQSLWRESIGVGNDALLLQFEQQRFSPEHSMVALDGPRVVGAIAMDISGEIPMAAYMAVETSYRGRWPYPLLMREAHASLRRAGYSRVRFKTNPQHHPGLKNFAEKIDGQPCGREIYYVLDL